MLHLACLNKNAEPRGLGGMPQAIRPGYFLFIEEKILKQSYNGHVTAITKNILWWGHHEI